ncbi:hypothetical protein EWM64_g1470 [Hericium alpestre]|uniref:Uncharacterized protein n=1 Tax=Hericium alpestre TaxID=135208 RepID=A0A4Z0A729_9AGAM|nr:hypothetical protein EWM64_g1470 [Hericium alpestre]
MSTIALGVAFASVQLVYHAYTKVKTNRARCTTLVERCQYIVDRLQNFAASDDDGALRDRMHQLEMTFEFTAQTIAQVGQLGIITSLLQSETTAVQVQACNDALTELLTLFNLEEVVEVGRWQRNFEAARLRDHEELLQMGNRIEDGNAAISRELAQQGTTLAEVYRLVQETSASKHDFAIEAVPPTSPPPVNRLAYLARTLSTPSSSRLSSAQSSKPESVEGNGCVRRSSTSSSFQLPNPWSSRVNTSPARSSTKLFSPSWTPSRRRTIDSSRSAKIAAFCDEPKWNELVSVAASKASSYPAAAFDPPPPYQLRIANPSCSDSGSNAGDAAADEEQASLLPPARYRAASVEAVRAPDSPVPYLSTPYLPEQPNFVPADSLVVKRASSRRKRRESAAPMPAGTPTLRRSEIVFHRRKTISSERPSFAFPTPVDYCSVF